MRGGAWLVKHSIGQDVTHHEDVSRRVECRDEFGWENCMGEKRVRENVWGGPRQPFYYGGVIVRGEGTRPAQLPHLDCYAMGWAGRLGLGELALGAPLPFFFSGLPPSSPPLRKLGAGAVRIALRCVCGAVRCLELHLH
jgi:hypothetical protein